MNSRLILVVDDDEKSRRLACDVLQHHGYHAVPAVSGEEALALSRPAAPDLVLLDIQMPGIDGYDTIRHLREMYPQQHVPVIAMTASVSMPDQGRIRAEGFDGLLPKPVLRIRDIVRVVEAALAPQPAPPPHDG